MDTFLAELESLLHKHNATIVRSADNTNGLVVCVPDGNGNWRNEAFVEEISDYEINSGRHRTVS